GDDGALPREELAGREVVVAGERADRDVAALVADVGEVGEPPDVDEQGRPCEAELHEREERVPSGEQLRILGLAEQPDRVVDRGRDLVVEGARDHCAPPRMAFQTRSGVAGMSMSFTPNGLSASTTAFMTAAMDAIV